jgi:hypothetical protein
LDILRALTQRNSIWLRPIDPDPRKWLAKEWIDQYTGKQSRITTRGHCGSKQTARVKTYGDIVAEYEFHPESKCADAFGNPCGKQTTGLLGRRHIKIDQIKCTGKESNSLADVDTGLVHAEKNAYTEYVDPKRDEWMTKIQPVLKKLRSSRCDCLSKNVETISRAGR